MRRNNENTHRQTQHTNTRSTRTHACDWSRYALPCARFWTRAGRPLCRLMLAQEINPYIQLLIDRAAQLKVILSAVVRARGVECLPTMCARVFYRAWHVNHTHATSRQKQQKQHHKQSNPHTRKTTSISSNMSGNPQQANKEHQLQHNPHAEQSSTANSSASTGVSTGTTGTSSHTTHTSNNAAVAAATTTVARSNYIYPSTRQVRLSVRYALYCILLRAGSVTGRARHKHALRCTGHAWLVLLVHVSLLLQARGTLR